MFIRVDVPMDNLLKIILVLFLTFFQYSSTQWVREMENPNLFEGDMVLTPEQKRAITQPNAFGAVHKPRKLPSAFISYEFAPEIANDSVTVREIMKAFALVKKHSCLRFFPLVNRLRYKWYLYFYKGQGCSAPVGYQGLVPHNISIGSGCAYHMTIMHQLFHVFGFYHEQSRPDRDDYVTIHLENVDPGAENKFIKLSNEIIDSRGSPYDLRSIMHFAWSAWAKYGDQNLVTVETKNPLDKYEIGQRKQMSNQDQYQLNKMYHCFNWRARYPTPQPTNYVRPPQSCKNIFFDCDYKKFMGYCDHWKVRYMCKRSCNLCKGNQKKVIQKQKK